METRTEAPNDLEATAMDLVLSVGLFVRRARAETHRPGLTVTQVAALSRLSRAGPMTTADLARAEFVKPQSMATVLGHLEEEGLVCRQPHPTDGRQVLFALTDKGGREMDKRSIAKREWVAGAIAKLSSSERKALVAAIPLINRLADS